MGNCISAEDPEELVESPKSISPSPPRRPRQSNQSQKLNHRADNIGTHLESLGINCYFKNSIREINNLAQLEQEINFLSKMNHPNVLQCFFYYRCDERNFLISEPTSFPLKDARHRQVPIKLVAKQLASAIEYMQEKRIVHLDLTPDSVQIQKNDGGFSVKVMNFRYAVQLPNMQNFTQTRFFNFSSLQFTPTEVSNDSKAYLSSDVWSLGYILRFFKIQNSKARSSRQKNGKVKAENPLSLDAIKNNTNDDALCKNLIEKVLVRVDKRMDIKDVLKHPYFWTAKESLDFILEIAIMLESIDKELRKEVFTGSKKVINTGNNVDWTTKVPKKLMEEIQKERQEHRNRFGGNNADQVDGSKILSLITTIRNMIVHGNSSEVIEIVGENDEAFFNFWAKKFPLLILHLYEFKNRYENREN